MVLNLTTLKQFYYQKKVLITGNTGFKGVWLSLLLIELGAQVYGYSLPQKTNTKPNLFNILKLHKQVKTYFGDIRNAKKINKLVQKIQPDIIFHLAAQPIVKDSYIKTPYTYEVNVMGTVNILEAVRQLNKPVSFVNITTDKVYQNNENDVFFKETDILNGSDPYANSKSCSELVTDCYKQTLMKSCISIATARAGNIIGGGDFDSTRVVPALVKAIDRNTTFYLTVPVSIRPYQFILDALLDYVLIAYAQFVDKNYAQSYNICCNNEYYYTDKLVNMFLQQWKGQHPTIQEINSPFKQSIILKLDNKKFQTMFQHSSLYSTEESIKKTAIWYYNFIQNPTKIKDFTFQQIKEFLKEYENITNKTTRR